jgi:hypothetical protein
MEAASRSRLVGMSLALAALLLTGLPGRAGADHSQLSLMSTGPNGGNGAFRVAFAGATADGARVFFTTPEPLVSSDTDFCSWAVPQRPCVDVYERANGTTSLTSTGPTATNAAFDAAFHSSTGTGSRVLFSTREALVATDTDTTACATSTGSTACPDIYERSAGATTLVSTGPPGGGAFNPSFAAASGNGSRVLFTSLEPLVATDQDASEDLYEQSNGTTTLLSKGPIGGNGAFDGLWSGSSTDGSRVFFRTGERLVSADSDSQADVYQYSGGSVTLASVGPNGGNGPQPSAFGDASADGARVFFSTEESLVAADTDSTEDVYERSGGSTTLVSTGASGNGATAAFFDGASNDGSRVLFRTRSSLVSADTDASVDVYERSGGTTTLLSTGTNGGNGAFDAHFAGSSADGTRVFLLTREALVTTDTDGRLDLYRRSSGTTTLVSSGPNGGNGAFDAYFAGASRGGGRVFLHTDEALVSMDTDTFQDVYEVQGDKTTLISIGPNGGNGPTAAYYVGASEDGTRVFVYTGEKLLSADTDAAADIYMSTALTGYPRPRGAPFALLKLVLAYKRCESGNATHGLPLVGASCSPPVPESDHLTVGTDDANGKAPYSVGSVQLTELGESPVNLENGDQADVKVEIDVTDVRRRGDLLDYVGELEARFGIRVTDRFNGATLTDPATVVDAPLSLPVPCIATPDTTIGSTCKISTSVDAVFPGIVVEKQRAIWQMDQVELLDGGADGDADTPPNTLFMRQGTFAP